jgi:NAD(P)-dependent dehydrogenase (short-subunit alcohol dehydrogenase family)
MSEKLSSAGPRWSIVTGAAGGIGIEIIRLFAHSGPVLAVDRDRVALEKALRALDADASEIVPAIADIGSAEEIAAAFASLPTGALISRLVNCAAVFDHQPAETMTLEAWNQVIRVNLTGAFLCCQAAFARMGKGSVIINIGSINGHRVIPTHANYAVSKAGLAMLTQCLAVEWARHGIRVVSVSPGIVDTAMNRRVEEQAGIDAAEVQARLPMGRYATPEEIARVVDFLASEDAAYISGADLLVDGAWTPQGAS